jgi:glycosyltransferase involved in cell wall biosynthesis
MTKISAAIIARNREKEIESCLKSLRGVDEIVVLDTGSVDKTPKIATANGAIVYYARWDDDFAAARNRCLDYVHNPWVLSIDTDETLTTGVKSLYDTVNTNFSSKVIGVLIDQPSGGFYGARLFRKNSCHWQRAIHEELSHPADTVTDEVIIQHKPAKDHTSHADRNIEILRKALERSPLSFMDAYYLGEELLGICQYDTALYWLQLYVELAPVIPNLTSEAHYLIADCYCHLHRVGRAIEALISAIKVNPQMKAAYDRLYQLTRNETWATKSMNATNQYVLKIR